MRTWAIPLAIISFLALWAGCTCKHLPEIEKLAAKYDAASTPKPGASPAAVAESAALTAALTGETLTLSGIVPTAEAKTEILARARSLYGEDKVVDAMTVAPDGRPAPEGWLKGALAALPWAKTVGFTASERTMTLQGSVPTDKVKSDTLTLAKKTLGAGWAIDDRLHVGAGGKAMGTLISEAKDRKVALSGALPSTEARDAVRAAAQKRLGADGFTDSLKVAETTSAVDPEWLAIAEKAAVWGKVAPVLLEDRTVTLRGELPTDAAKSARYEYVRKTLGAGWKLVDGMTVKASAAPSSAGASGNDTTATNLEAYKGVEFETGSAELTPRGKTLLDGAARVIAATGATRYEIAGHTDSRGSETGNLRLSEARAKTVLRYLVGKKIDEGRLEAKGYGATRPIASDDSPSNQARNRRIEFTERK